MNDQTRKPVTPVKLPVCQVGGCNNPAEWVAENDEGPTFACSAHIGQALDPEGANVVAIALWRRP